MLPFESLFSPKTVAEQQNQMFKRSKDPVLDLMCYYLKQSIESKFYNPRLALHSLPSCKICTSKFQVLTNVHCFKLRILYLLWIT